MDIRKFIEDYGVFSDKAFGVGKRSVGITEHLKKEINELELDPNDPFEWVDVILLGMDGLRRLGYTPEQITNFLEEKFNINKKRIWPSSKDENLALTHKKSLYVKREVISPEIMKFAASLGFHPEELHVTIAHSRAEVEWGFGFFTPMTNEWSLYHAFKIDVLSGGAVVLKFDDEELKSRHQEFLRLGASYDYNEYIPHITLGFSALAKRENYDCETIYVMNVKFGSEIFEELQN